MATGDLYSDVKDLPESLQKALTGLGYCRSNVPILPADAVTLGDHGSKGYQAFAAVVRLDTGDAQVERGSWGGPNAWSHSAVDNDHGVYAIPEGVAVVKGDRGGAKDTVYARIYVHPSNITKFLPASPSLTDREQAILKVYSGIKPSYRRDELRRDGIELTEGDINGLVTRGFLKRNAAGASQITTDGRNAIARRVP